jgi:hypothetical protein
MAANPVQAPNEMLRTVPTAIVKKASHTATKASRLPPVEASVKSKSASAALPALARKRPR